MKLSKSAFALATIFNMAVMSFGGMAHAGIISDVTNPGDFIIAIDLDGSSSSPGAETSVNAIIDNSAQKYLNFGGPNSGLIFTPTNNPSNVAVTSLTLTTANDAPNRDPASFSLWGTNDSITSPPHSAGAGESWTAIVLNELIALPADRLTTGPTVNFANNIFYSSFRLVFPTLRGSDFNLGCGGVPCMQIAELQLGADLIAVPEPSIIALFGLGLLGMGFARRRKA